MYSKFKANKALAEIFNIEAPELTGGNVKICLRRGTRRYNSNNFYVSILFPNGLRLCGSNPDSYNFCRWDKRSDWTKRTVKLNEAFEAIGLNPRLVVTPVRANNHYGYGVQVRMYLPEPSELELKPGGYTWYNQPYGRRSDATKRANHLVEHFEACSVKAEIDSKI